jgi:hypothetical protein
MNEFVRLYPDVRFSSLPHLGEDGERKVELGIRGTRLRVAEASDHLKAEVAKLGYRYMEAA